MNRWNFLMCTVGTGSCVLAVAGVKNSVAQTQEAAPPNVI